MASVSREVPGPRPTLSVSQAPRLSPRAAGLVGAGAIPRSASGPDLPTVRPTAGPMPAPPQLHVSRNRHHTARTAAAATVSSTARTSLSMTSRRPAARMGLPGQAPAAAAEERERRDREKRTKTLILRHVELANDLLAAGTLAAGLQLVAGGASTVNKNRLSAAACVRWLVCCALVSPSCESILSATATSQRTRAGLSSAYA